MTWLIHGKVRKTASLFAGKMNGVSSLKNTALGGHGTGSNRLMPAGVLLETILALLLIAMGIGAIGTLLRSTMQSRIHWGSSTSRPIVAGSVKNGAAGSRARLVGRA